MAKIDRSNLRQYLRFDQLNNEELLAFLRTKIHIFEQSDKVSPWAEKEPHDRLIVYKDDDGEIKRVTPGNPTAENTLQNLRGSIKNELMNVGSAKVAWTTAFSPVPVCGSFCSNEFGFRPMPEAAAQPDVVVAEHPFLLGVLYQSCGSPTVNCLRAFKATGRLSRLLSVLVQRRIWIQTRTEPHRWTYVKEGDGPLASKWLQQGYFPYGAEETDDFTICSNYEPVESMKQRWFFSCPPTGVGLDISLIVPEGLGELVTLFWALPPETVERAERAMHWLLMFEDIWLVSKSSGYVALVSAIECLLEPKGETCGGCGQPVEQATQKFAEFLTKWCGSNENAFVARLKKFYARRSDLAHGQDLFSKDAQPWQREQLSADNEREEARNLYSLVNAGFLRWLLVALSETQETREGAAQQLSR